MILARARYYVLFAHLRWPLLQFLQLLEEVIVSSSYLSLFDIYKKIIIDWLFFQTIKYAEISHLIAFVTSPNSTGFPRIGIANACILFMLDNK